MILYILYYITISNIQANNITQARHLDVHSQCGYVYVRFSLHAQNGKDFSLRVNWHGFSLEILVGWLFSLFQYGKRTGSFHANHLNFRRHSNFDPLAIYWPPFDPLAICRPLGWSHRPLGVDIDHFGNPWPRRSNINTNTYCTYIHIHIYNMHMYTHTQTHMYVYVLYRIHIFVSRENGFPTY